MNLSELRARVPIKKFMVGYLAVLLLIGAVGTDDPARLLRGAVIVAVYAGVDLLWTKIRDRVWYLPLSSFISGLILANLLAPSSPFAWVVAAPAIAALGKHLIRRGPRHIFNPAGLALTVVGLFLPGAVSWWGAAWGAPALWIVGLVGFFILWRQQRFHVATSFLAVYVAGLIALFVNAGVPLTELPSILRPQLIDGTLLFFTSVMLIEPVTTSFATRKLRMIFGALAAALAVLASYLSRFVPIPDVLLAGLLGANCIVTLATTKRK